MKPAFSFLLFLNLTATDGYKLVFSRNEPFNSSNDNNTLIINNLDTNPVKSEKGNIALLVAGDDATGRRFVKGAANYPYFKGKLAYGN